MARSMGELAEAALRAQNEGVDLVVTQEERQMLTRSEVADWEAAIIAASDRTGLSMFIGRPVQVVTD